MFDPRDFTAQERREIAALGQIECDRIGRIAPASFEEMALGLLKAHLVLIRDCGGILPAHAPKIAARGKVTDGRGVSLGSGINGPV